MFAMTAWSLAPDDRDLLPTTQWTCLNFLLVSETPDWEVNGLQLCHGKTLIRPSASARLAEQLLCGCLS